VRHQLHPDERQDDRQPGREVGQAVEQPLHQDEQRPQAQQREGVRDEDDVRLIGDAGGRGDRVEGEQDVGAADRDEHDEQRSGEASTG